MKKIFVAGHNGMVGSALVRQLAKDENNQIFTVNRKDLDLTNQQTVNDYFSSNQFDQVYLAAAKVGGIYANNHYPADFIYQNLIIQTNVINSAHVNGVQNLLFLGSSCIYPKMAPQPISEDSLLTGQLEATNEPYAIAKIAGIKLCESYNRQYDRNYRAVMPTNLYGIHDNFHPENSHVIPALIRRFHDAKINNEPEVHAWGTGEPMREFLYVDDMASASIYLMNLRNEIYQSEIDSMLSHINVGTGKDITIKNLTMTIAEVVGYGGVVRWDKTKPDGTPRKLLDVTRLERLGWKSTIDLTDGLKITYKWFLENQALYKK